MVLKVDDNDKAEETVMLNKLDYITEKDLNNE